MFKGYTLLLFSLDINYGYSLEPSNAKIRKLHSAFFNQKIISILIAVNLLLFNRHVKVFAWCRDAVHLLLTVPCQESVFFYFFFPSTFKFTNTMGTFRVTSVLCAAILITAVHLRTGTGDSGSTFEGVQ